MIFISVGLGVLILSTILSILVLDFGDKFHSTIFIGELIGSALLVAGILKIKSDLNW